MVSRLAFRARSDCFRRFGSECGECGASGRLLARHSSRTRDANDAGAVPSEPTLATLDGETAAGWRVWRDAWRRTRLARCSRGREWRHRHWHRASVASAGPRRGCLGRLPARLWRVQQCRPVPCCSQERVRRDRGRQGVASFAARAGQFRRVAQVLSWASEASEVPKGQLLRALRASAASLRPPPTALRFFVSTGECEREQTSAGGPRR